MQRIIFWMVGAFVAAGLTVVGGPVLNAGFQPEAAASWVAQSGTWTVADGLLLGESGRALFPVELGSVRRVEVVVDHVQGEWASVIGKYESDDAWVEARVSATGVTLVAWSGGREKVWTQAVAVAFPAIVIVAFVGERARVLVNGETVLQASDGVFADLGGDVGLGAQGRAGFDLFHASSLSGPVLITSLGQSPGALMAKVLADRVGIEGAYETTAKPEMVEGNGTLILVIGASSKGLGAAGISVEDESARGAALVAKAQALGWGIVVMHIEGEPRRGTLTDELIDEFTPVADYVVVKADGNADGLFTSLCAASGIPLRTIVATAQGADVLADLFGLWK